MATTMSTPGHTTVAGGRTDQTGVCTQAGTVNVGDIERLASTVGGATLAVVGLSRGSLGGLLLAAMGGGLVYRGLTGHCHLYGTLGLTTAGRRKSPQAAIPATQAVKVEKSITVGKSPEEVFRFWRHLENLPRIMRHLESVEVEDDRRSHWVARGPAGSTVEWDAEIINERPNELIAWKSVDGSDVDTAGSVHFRRAPSGQGTEVRIHLKYDPPAGRLGAGIAWLFGASAAQQIDEDLRNFKQVMEGNESFPGTGRSTASAR